jgi:DNA-binding LacI/PurR family transcriptional regulator
MTRHIISLGHSRIGFIAGHPNQLASERRLLGYCDALKDAGIAAPAELRAQGLFTYRSGLDAAEQLLNLAEMSTAIFASNDDMAAATVAVVHRRGLDAGSGKTVTSSVAPSTLTMAFCPPSVIQAWPSGPTMTPCGADPAPSSMRRTSPVAGSR